VHAGPTARAGDLPCARQAGAGAADPNRLRVTQARVLVALFLCRPHGLTDHDHMPLHGMGQTSAVKRRHDLMLAGLVELTDRKRRTPTGALAHVWAITDDGLAAVRHALGVCKADNEPALRRMTDRAAHLCDALKAARGEG